MSDYLRPTIPAVVYQDAEGNPIAYGRRWNEEPAPEDAYEQAGNLQRFAPLHTTVGVLIDWLQSTFDVTVEEDPLVVDDLLRTPNDVVRAVGSYPANPAQHR